MNNMNKNKNYLNDLPTDLILYIIIPFLDSLDFFNIKQFNSLKYIKEFKYNKFITSHNYINYKPKFKITKLLYIKETLGCY